MKKMKTIELVLCAMFAALSAVLSQVSIPIGAVPINLTHVSIFTAVGLLGVKYGTISQVIFVLVGAAGIPVFSGFSGGISIIFGYTGGFIIGYICCAFITGIMINRFGTSIRSLILAMCAGWIVTYALGIPWFMHITKSNLASALSLSMLPFLPGDLFKTILSATLINRLHPILRNKMGNQYE